MTKVLIIDDEPLACDLVQEYLQDHSDIEVIGQCHDGFQGTKMIHEKQPDLIFLDVQMPKITGFEVLELLENPPAVIFTTAFDEYALQAFEANAIDYLLKPFSKERFDKALEKFSQKAVTQPSIDKLLEDVQPLQKDQNRIVIKDGGRIRIIPIKDVIRLEADDDYVKIYTIEGNFMKKKTLNSFEQNLSPDFFVRIHRSHLLNITHLNRVDAYEKNSHIALLKDGSTVPISRSGYQKLKDNLRI
jgi:two-component system LytT family response regulator